MELRNSLESVVAGIVEALTQGRKDVCRCERCNLDMQAYALNHLPPRYIVSERGITHAEMNILKDAQFNADVVRTVSEAVAAIASRPRPGYKHSSRAAKPRKNSEAAGKRRYYNFPHLLGTAFLNREMDLANGARVALLDESGRIAAMAEPSWPNPCVIRSSTMGIFTFWPAVVPAPAGKQGKRDFRFTVRITYKGKKSLMPVTVRSEPEGKAHGHVRNDNVLRLPPVFLSGKD
jgi:competence protein ComFB